MFSPALIYLFTTNLIERNQPPNRVKVGQHYGRHRGVNQWLLFMYHETRTDI